MNTIETIASRRSIRKFSNKPVSEEQIHRLLEAGMNAPSAKNTRPWHFMVIKDKSTIDQIVEICPNGSMLRGSDLAILVLADLNLTDDYFVIDCAASIQNILLAAHESGLGTCWIGVYPREPRVKGLKVLFSLPENIIPHSLIAVGYPDETKDPNKNFSPDRVHMEKW